MSAGWEKFNENNPYGKPGKGNSIEVISEENLMFAQERRRVEKAVRDRTANAADMAAYNDYKRLWSRLREKDGGDE